MSQTAKILLIIANVFALLGLSVCGAGYWWFQANKEELRGEVDRIKAEAEAFARTADEKGCVDETLRRMQACDPEEIVGAICRGQHQAFFDRCVMLARPTPGFCDDVPASSEIVETLTWSMERCEEIGRPDGKGCAQLFAKIGNHCDKSARSQ
jgi:hypothetical protein